MIAATPAAGDLLPGSLSASVLGASWTWTLALLVGAAAFRLVPGDRPAASDPPEGWTAAARLTAWAVAGVPLVSLAWLALSAASRLRESAVIATASVLAAGALAVAWSPIRAALRRPAPGRETVGHVGLVAGLVVALAVLGCAALACLPTLFYDDLVYHLGLPRQALLAGRWPELPFFHYAFMPAGWDAGHVLSLSLGGGTGPQLASVVALALLAATCARLGRLGGRPGAAVAAAALLVTSPFVLRLAPLAANDLFVGLALASALEHLLATGGRDPVRTGLLAGAAWSAKYTALPAVAGLALAAVLLRRRSSGVPRAALGGALLVVVTLAVALPWTARTWRLTGNPLYPAFSSALGGSATWDRASAERVSLEASHGAFPRRGLAALPLSIAELATGTGDLGPPAGPARTFVPLALLGLLLRRRVRHAGPLLLVAAVTWAGWCLTSLHLRYALVMVVALVPFAAAVLDRGLALLDGHSVRRRAAAAAAAIGLGAFLALAAWHGLSGHARFIRLEADAGEDGGTVRREHLVRRLALAAAGRDLAGRLPDGAGVLLVGDARLALVPRRALASSFYDQPVVLPFLRGAAAVEAVNARVAEAGMTHVLVNFQELRRAATDYRWLDRLSADERTLLDRWLDEGLAPIARWGEVVLFELRAPPR